MPQPVRRALPHLPLPCFCALCRHAEPHGCAGGQVTRPSSHSAPANHQTQTLSDRFSSLQSNMRQMKAVSTENSDSKNDLSTAFSCTKEAPLPLPLHRSKTWKRTRSVVVSLVADLQHFAPSLGCSLFAKARLIFAQKKAFSRLPGSRGGSTVEGSSVVLPATLPSTVVQSCDSSKGWVKFLPVSIY